MKRIGRITNQRGETVTLLEAMADCGNKPLRNMKMGRLQKSSYKRV